MTLLRSIIFNLGFILWTVIVVIVCVPLLAGPQRWAQWVQTTWSTGVISLARRVIGIEYEIRGRENLPDGSAIIASKHQSVWETAMFPLLLRNPGIVVKKELRNIPFYGWYFRKTDIIPVDRRGHAGAMRVMLRSSLSRSRTRAGVGRSKIELILRVSRDRFGGRTFSSRATRDR